MKKKWIIIVGLIGILAMGGIAACKQGCHSGSLDKFDLQAITSRIASRLDLTESQKADFDQMAEEIIGKAKTMHADRDANHQQLAELVRQDTVDKTEVNSLIDQKMVQMREIADFVVERLIAFHSTLTPEQREKIATHIEEHNQEGCRLGFR